MTKETMIWQTLSMIVAGMAVNKTLPETKEQFIEKVTTDAAKVLDYPLSDIKQVFIEHDCAGYARIMCQLNTNKPIKP